MHKIVVVGLSGAGRTGLAQGLGDRLGLPVTHLDGMYHRDDGSALPAEDFADAQRALVAGPTWVVDGNYASTLDIRLAAADTVVFLDMHPPAALMGIMARRHRHTGERHPHEGVYDPVNPGVLRYVLAYRHTMRPRVRRLLAEHVGPDTTVHTFTTRRAADRWLESLPIAS